jgi:hypothetical protein
MPGMLTQQAPSILHGIYKAMTTLWPFIGRLVFDQTQKRVIGFGDFRSGNCRGQVDRVCLVQVKPPGG